jgi:hypothetical protein
MHKYSLLPILLFLIIGCKGKLSTGSSLPEDVVPTIDIMQGVKNRVPELLLSDALDSIKIVPLETKPTSFIKDNRWNLKIEGGDIFIHPFADYKIFHFSGNGRFLNTIGKRGNGPGEYNAITNFFVDREKKTVEIITSNVGIHVYNYDGLYTKVSSRFHIDQIVYTMFNESYFKYKGDYFIGSGLAIYRPISTPKDSLWSFVRLDSTFAIKQRYYNPEVVGREDELMEHRGDPTAYEWINYWELGVTSIDLYHDNLSAKYYGVDTIYRMESPADGFKVAYKLSLGERPNYEMTHQRFKAPAFFDYLWVSDFYETKDYLFFTASKSSQTYVVRYDKATGRVCSTNRKGEIEEERFGPFTYLRIQRPFVLKNDVCGGGDFQIDYKCGGK